MTSILELLLTHNPDFNRFNVEDSISKQFQLKVSILVYLNDKTVDINAIKSRLKTIYQQRSNIAHGNFSAVNKYINGLSKKEGKEEYFDDLVVDLYKYVRSVLEEYLKDFRFVEFLKENWYEMRFQAFLFELPANNSGAASLGWMQRLWQPLTDPLGRYSKGTECTLQNDVTV